MHQFHYRSNVCYLQVLGQGIVILSSPEAASTLLEKRGAIYYDWVLFVRYNEGFKRQKKLMQCTLGPRSIPAYHPMMQVETISFIRNLVQSPHQYMDHTCQYAGGLMLAVLYGYKATTNDDRLLRLAGECVRFFANEVTSSSGIWLVDIFPVLKHVPTWVPGAGFRRKATYWKKTLRRLAEEPYTYTRGIDQGSNTPLFCASMYVGSADTTISTVSHFLLAMMDHPEVLKKVHLEIDTVIVEAVLSKMWRWGVPVPISVINLPHCLTEDNIYRGMFIPKGTLVFANIWAILRDESIFKDTSKFQPDRFLDEKDLGPRNYVFRFGCRRCPGADLVESSIWLLLVTMMATLDISKPVKDGCIIEPIVDYRGNAKFRSSHAASLVE
ncbi:cytochrome P450 [Mycena capillaripes]|nr:cytochrome P450 [Mycena capillaripes]